ncbi:hypothetical protein [Marinigracilibium pacificum]|uniref:Uncharacterized protein n=1 Tax=Marinigracilibium pacificum TaxID=2729599 RepID=A0A848J127_9BACT|nr:hypothetical protein [Marinigracilibium pacificum]NMM47999.1 hypothetical protein [Marinigracilibium pacificum]
MNLNESNIIDDYLMGNMSAVDRMAFEQKMAGDQELQREVSMQKDIIKSLEQARVQQLKARLNSITVSNTTWYQSTFGKITIGISILAAIIIGSWLLFSDDNQSADVQLSDSIASQEQTISPIDKSTESNVDAIEKVEEVIAEETQEQTSIVTPTPEKEESKKDNNDQSKIAEKKQPVTKEETQSNIEPSVDSKTETQKSDTSEEVNSYNPYRLVEIETTKGSNFDFHYKFYNNKLSLYGDFGGEKPYEILEVNNENVRGLFLYYDGKFFELDTTHNTIPLTALDNVGVIQNLMEIKNNK